MDVQIIIKNIKENDTYNTVHAKIYDLMDSATSKEEKAMYIQIINNLNWQHDHREEAL